MLSSWESVDDSLEKILKLNFGQVSKAEVGSKKLWYVFFQDYEPEFWKKLLYYLKAITLNYT